MNTETPKPTRRRWLYEVNDQSGNSAYVDEAGNETGFYDAKEHIATDAEAGIEAERRVNLWETNYNTLAVSVIKHSRGKAHETPKTTLV